MTLRTGKHTVTVRPRILGQDQYGPGVEVLGQPSVLRCNVQPVSADEREALGLQTVTVYRIAYFPQEHGGKPWPGGPYSQVEWNGRLWDQRGEALDCTMSETTGHQKIIITAAGTEVA